MKLIKNRFVEWWFMEIDRYVEIKENYKEEQKRKMAKWANIRRPTNQSQHLGWVWVTFGCFDMFLKTIILYILDFLVLFSF